MDLQAPWIGKTREEYHESISEEREFVVQFSLQGVVSIFASTKEEALEEVRKMSPLDLIDYVEETDID